MKRTHLPLNGLRVLDAAGSAQPRAVKVGLNNNVTAEITAGLAAGEQVVLGDGAAAPAKSGMRGGPPPQ